MFSRRHNKNTTRPQMSKRTREELEMEAGPSTASPGASASPAPVPPVGEVQLLKVPQVGGRTPSAPPGFLRLGGPLYIRLT